MTSTGTDDYDLTESQYGTIASIPSPEVKRRQPGAIAYYPNNALHRQSYRGGMNVRSARQHQAHYSRQESGNTTSTGGTGGLIEEVLSTVTDSNWDNQDLTAVKLFPPSSRANSYRTHSASTRATDQQLFDCGSTTMSDTSGWTVETRQGATLPTATPIDSDSFMNEVTVSKVTNRSSTGETYFVEEAVLIDENDDDSRWLRGKRFWFMLATVIAMIMFAVAAIIMSVQSDDKSESVSDGDEHNNFHTPELTSGGIYPSVAPSVTHNPTSSPSMNPSTSRAVEMRAKLEETYINGAALFDDSSTPQAEALDWLVDDDGLQISPDAPNLLQRYILALLYFATNGSNWEFSYNWLGPVHECQWRNERGDQYEVYAGVFNCSAFDKVTSLELAYNSLVGTIPSELGQLDELEVLALSLNNLSGPLPSEIGELIKLTKLNLEFNSLTGTVPSSFGYLTNLDRMFLHYNSINGTMPNQVCALDIDRIWADCDSDMECSCCHVCY